jgi:hypothetical protein
MLWLWKKIVNMLFIERICSEYFLLEITNESWLTLNEHALCAKCEPKYFTWINSPNPYSHLMKKSLLLSFLLIRTEAQKQRYVIKKFTYHLLRLANP